MTRSLAGPLPTQAPASRVPSGPTPGGRVRAGSLRAWDEDGAPHPSANSPLLISGVVSGSWQGRSLGLGLLALIESGVMFHVEQ